MTDKIQEYLEAYDTQKQIEADLAAAKQITNEAKGVLMSLLESMGINKIGRGDRTISLSKRSFGKVVDFDLLVNWISEQDVPRSEYIQEVIIKGSTRDPRGIHAMVEDAQKEALDTGRSISECLPPGLELAVVPVVTVRRSSVRSRKASGAKGKLEDILDEG